MEYITLPVGKGGIPAPGKSALNQILKTNLPNWHTTLFQRPYNVILTLWTLDGRRFDVVGRQKRRIESRCHEKSIN